MRLRVTVSKVGLIDVVISGAVGLLAGAALTLPLIGSYNRVTSFAEYEAIHEERAAREFARGYMTRVLDEDQEDEEQAEAEAAMDRDWERAEADRLGNVAGRSAVLSN